MNINFDFILDYDYLTRHEKSDFRFVGLDKIYEISQRKFFYKKFQEEQPVLRPSYLQFKMKLKTAREHKLPFRALDYDKETKKLDKPEEVLVAESRPLESSLRLCEQILWLHGSNSAVLEMLPYTDYALIPSGMLLNRGLAPMSGEISQGGMEINGVNQRGISVDTIRGFNRCWEYATRISLSFYPTAYSDPEGVFLKSLDDLKNLSPDSNSWDLILIRLTRLKQWNPDKFVELVEKYSAEIAKIISDISNKNSEKELNVLKALDYDRKKLLAAKDSEAIRNEIEAEFPPDCWDGYIYNWYELDEYNPIFALHIDEEVSPRIRYLCGSKFERTWKELVFWSFRLRTIGIESLEAVRGSWNEKRWKLVIQPLINKGFYDPIEIADIENLVDKLIRKKILARMAKNRRPFQARLDRMLKLFQEPPKVHFTELQKDFITQPFPILFASTKKKSSREFFATEFRLDEAKLGQEIDLLFVRPADKAKMEQWLSAHGLGKQVRVEGIERFQQLAALPLVHANFQVHDLHPFVSASDHTKLQLLIREQAAPLYRVTYPDGSSREHHGVRHAAAVYFFANCIAEMYRERGMKSTRNPQHLLLAAFLHDCARENDGVDLWDKQSGEKCKEMLIKHLACSEEEATQFSRCIAEKDAKSPEFLEQKILHDADCIEIIRCLTNESDFQPDELWMLKDLNQELVFQFVKEAKLFIGVTEKAAVKEFITKSENPVKTLVQICDFVESHSHRIPLLSRFITSARDAFYHISDYSLNAEIEQVILNDLG